MRGTSTHAMIAKAERAYWLTALTVGGLLAAFSPWIASGWSSSSLPAGEAIRPVLLLIAALVTVQWPITLYESILTAAGRMPQLHAVGSAMRTVGTGTAVGVVLLAHANLSTFLTVMVLSGSCHVASLAYLVRTVPLRHRAPTEEGYEGLRELAPFAAGVTILGVLSALLTHSDKLFVSRFVSLPDFALYTLATVASTGLQVFALPVLQTLLPQLTGCVGRGDRHAARATFHQLAQTGTVLVFPAVAVLIGFAPELLLLWTNDRTAATEAVPVLRWFAAGTALNTLMNSSYASQLAHGRLDIGIALHVGLLAFYLPTVALLATFYGSTGAAAAWCLMNGLYVLVGVPLTLSKTQDGRLTDWIINDTIRPIASAGLVVAVAVSAFRVVNSNWNVSVLYIALTLIIAWSAAAISGGFTRGAAIQVYRRLARTVSRAK